MLSRLCSDLTHFALLHCATLHVVAARSRAAANSSRPAACAASYAMLFMPCASGETGGFNKHIVSKDEEDTQSILSISL